jgi:ankyrin repeat protein
MFRSSYSFLVAAMALLLPARAHCQATNPQVQLWDGAKQGDTTVMSAALRHGAVIDSLDTRQNPNGRRSLNWAAWYDHAPAIQFLLSHGAPLEARNYTGFTALHHAAEAGSVEALQALLRAGADPQAPNGAGRLPIETARERGHTEIARILEGAIRSRKAHQ